MDAGVAVNSMNSVNSKVLLLANSFMPLFQNESRYRASRIVRYRSGGVVGVRMRVILLRRVGMRNRGDSDGWRKRV